MEAIPNIPLQEIPDGHDCGDCMWYRGCKRMDEINGTNLCQKLSQTQCPKNHFILASDWEERREVRQANIRKHQQMMRKKKRKKKR